MDPAHLDLRDDVTAIAVAVGVLLERYQVSQGVATRLLISSAAAAKLQVAEAARWLVRTRQLPRVSAS